MSTSRATTGKSAAASASTITTTTTTTTHITSCSRRQRWQPEEDALVEEYVRRHGPREWHLLRSRMGVSASRFTRDPKSCAERWKNYLRPGLKRQPLSPEEQAVALALQARHGNRWKLIAKSLPGRTPKRLGKWWEVFSDRQRKVQQQQQEDNNPEQRREQEAKKGQYDHILDTYVEKHVLPGASNVALEDGVSLMSGITSPGAADSGAAAVPGTPGPVLSLGTSPSSGVAVVQSTQYPPPHMRQNSSYMNNYYGGGSNTPPTSSAATHHQQLPPWLSTATGAAATIGPPHGMPTTTTTVTPSSSHGMSLTTSCPSNGGTNMLSVGLGGVSHSPPHPVPPDMFPQPSALQPQLAALGSLWRDVEDSRQGWLHHHKEATWRLGRLEQQLEAERARRAKDKVEQCQARMRALREEEAAAMERIDVEYRDQMAAIQRDAESREGRLLEGWAARHARLASVLDRIGSSAGSAGATAGAVAGGLHAHQPFGPQFPLGRPNNGGNM